MSKDRTYRVGKVINEISHPSADNEPSPFVIVLDTFEEMERKRNRFDQPIAPELIDTLRALSSQVPHLRVVVSGRSRPKSQLLPVPEEHVILVDDLPDDAADQLLNVFVQAKTPGMPVLPKSLTTDVVNLVGGSPLTLKLAAQVLVEQGKRAIVDAARRSAALGQVRNEFVRGFLYQRVLEHLEPADDELESILRDVTRAALAMRRVSSDSIAKVLLPALGRSVDKDLAERVFVCVGGSSVATSELRRRCAGFARRSAATGARRHPL